MYKLIPNIKTFSNNVSVLVLSFSLENTKGLVYGKDSFVNFFLKTNFVIIALIPQVMWISVDILAVVGSQFLLSAI